MPHIYIRMLTGVTKARKKKLAEDATAAVNKHLPSPTGMGKGLIEHELVEILPGNFARGGKLNASPSAYVIINFIEGRTLKQKRGIAKDMTEAVAKNLNIPPEAVIVEMVEFPPTNVSHAGKLTLDNPPPGIKLVKTSYE